MGFLVTMAVLLPLTGAFGLIWYFVKRGEIIDKRERVEAALSSLRAAEQKGRGVLGDATQVLSEAVASMQESWEESRGEVLRAAREQRAGSGKGTTFVWPMQLYPPGDLVEVFREVQRLSANEADDVQYLVEKVNARIGELRACIEKPFGRFVAQSMGIDFRDFRFVGAGEHPALRRATRESDGDIILLKPRRASEVLPPSADETRSGETPSPDADS